MKIGFDAKRAFSNKSGLGNYSRQLIEGLCSQYPENEYFLYTPENKGIWIPPSNSGTILPSKFIDKKLKSYWRSNKVASLAKINDISVFHGLSNELPLHLAKKNIPSIVTIHDLIFIRQPELYKAIDRVIYRKKWKYACENADKIVAISQATKNDIIEYLNINPNKIEVIYQDCFPLYYQPNQYIQEINITEKFNIPPNYILTVGTIEPRKNQLQTLKAWHLSGLYEEYPLIIVGKKTSYYKELKKYIDKNHLEQRVFFPEVNLVEDLVALYKNAIFSVYISMVEGFGLPVCESLNIGCPVITTKYSCLPETGGDAAYYSDPRDLEHLTYTMKLIIENDEERISKIKKGQLHVLKFRQENNFPKLIELYKSLC